MNKDISLFGLMLDAYQLNEFGIDVLKTCRMKLAYARAKYKSVEHFNQNVNLVPAMLFL